MQYQNYVGNPQLGDPAYYFRPVPQGTRLTSPLLPPNWGGGDFGTECNPPNPVVPVDSNGNMIEFPRFFTFKPPMYLHIDSNNRDVVAYPNPAFFRIDFPAIIRGVYSIEVLSVNYPNPDPFPADRYTLLLSGLPDGSKFVPQHQGNLGIFTPLITQNQAPNQTMNTVSKYAIAKMHFDSTRPDQCWRKSEIRYIKYYSPCEDKLKCLEFTLAYSDGTPLIFPQEETPPSWSAIFEVVCKAN